MIVDNVVGPGYGDGSAVVVARGIEAKQVQR